uniref:Uncharacterized protein n=1 Tax=Chlorobium phaeobacteroides (strain BS1) TaxID=331678 RepID=B3ENM2_CHLPB
MDSLSYFEQEMVSSIPPGCHPRARPVKSGFVFHRPYTGIHRLYFEASEAPSKNSELFFIFFLTFDFLPLTLFVDGCRITPCNNLNSTQGGMTVCGFELFYVV